MGEIKNVYSLEDDQCDTYRVEYTQKTCRCCLHGCEDDNLEIILDGESYRLNVPDVVSDVILGLLEGEFTVKKMSGGDDERS